MYVCNCHGVREAEISRTIRNGATSLRALRDVLGVGTCCGKCVCEVRDQLDRELASEDECTGCGRCQEGREPADAGSKSLDSMAMC